jgi:soluble lytic murein transglycosylase-like protein
MRALLAAACACACMAVGGCGSAAESGRASLPAPDAPLPGNPRALAADLTRTTVRLRSDIERWTAHGDPTHGGPPRAVTLLALHQQSIYRLLTARPDQARAVLALLPGSVVDEASDTLAARRALTAIPATPGPRPHIRVGPAEPAGRLRAHYLEAQRRFGIDWSVLAAVNFVESAFGRLRNASAGGARGPMQFIPATWAEYGMGGDINDPHDAVLGAANYLRRSGAPGDLEGALFAYNRSSAYVRAILRFAHRIRADPRTFYAYYAWQVYVAGPHGPVRVTGPR